MPELKTLSAAFDATCFLLREKNQTQADSAGRAVEPNYYLADCSLHSFPGLVYSEKPRYVAASATIGTGWRLEQYGDPQTLTRLGRAEDGPKDVAKLLRAVAAMLDLDQDAEVQAAIAEVERSVA